MRAGSKNIPPKTSAPASLGLFAAIVLAATAVGIGVLVFFFNPGTHGFYPICVFHSLTGFNCPGCGMTRSLYALLHGNLWLALKDNGLFVLTLAVLAFWGAWFAVRKMRRQPATLKMPPKFLWLLLVTVLVFAVIRNLPGFEWLSP